MGLLGLVGQAQGLEVNFNDILMEHGFFYTQIRLGRNSNITIVVQTFTDPSSGFLSTVIHV